MASAKAKIRHVFGDTFSCRAAPPDILVKLSGYTIVIHPLSYTIYLETALLNIFGQKSVIENMADCDVKRVTGPYFFG